MPKIKELVKWYRYNLKRLQEPREFIVVCHIDALDELLYVIRKTREEVEIEYLPEYLVKVTYLF